MSSSCPPLLERALASWPHWRPAPQQRPGVLAELLGGRTNRSFLVTAGEQRAVVRLNAVNGGDLGIDRNREARVLAAVEAAGLAPPVLYNDPERRFLVTAFIDGRTWTVDDLGCAEKRGRLARLIDRVQALEVDLPGFDYAEHLGHYWRQAVKRYPKICSERREAYEDFHRRLSALQKQGWQPVLCHHDLVAENIIEQDARLYLLDWEYAALGHRGVDRARSGLVRGNNQETIDELVCWLDRLWYLVNDKAVAKAG